MWLVRKKSPDTKNKWQTIYKSKDGEDAKAIYLQEIKLVLESVPTNKRENIESLLSCAFYSWQSRQTMSIWQANTEFSLYESVAAKHQDSIIRPTRTQLLDNVLN